MTYLSICSGIEAASVAWEPLGMTPVGFAEIDRFPSAVLAHRFPHVTNYGDFTEITDVECDILVGGTPCQSFSVAGLRGGMDDDRGQLALQFCRLARRTRPAWVVWENVPGVLSSNGGRDFGSFLGALAELGYGFAYRILDAQYFGVPQRRRRVFVVGHLGDWRPAAAVLFERHSLQGNSPPSRKAKPDVAETIEAGSGVRRGAGINPGCIVGTVDSHIGSGGPDDNAAQAGHLIHCPAVSPAIKARDGKGPSSDGDGDGAPLIAHTLRGGYDASEDGTGRGTPIIPVAFQERGREGGRNLEWQEGIAYSLNAPNGGGRRQENCIAYRTSGNCGVMEQGDVTAALNCATDPTQQILRNGMAVRRLTPRECERLQGFPDDWTLIPYRGKPADRCPDGPRYKAIGNSMAVPVMRWIGRRIMEVSQC